MKKRNIRRYAPLIISVCLLFTTCNKKQPELGIVTVDVTKEYPKKAAIPIQDIAGVEYIALETNDEFLCDGQGGFAYVDDKRIIWYNRSDYNIFVFDKAGKALKKINRHGQSGEEYPFMMQVIFDNENGELYVLSQPKIFVYDLNGNYKRSFLHNTDNQKYPTYYNLIYNFNKDYLLCFRTFFDDDKNIVSYIIVSKQTGEKIKDISIPIEKRVANYVLDSASASVVSIRIAAAKSENHFLLNESSSDTIYKLSPDLSLTPLITRKPSIQQMEMPIFLCANVETNRYYFMASTKLTDFATYKADRKFPNIPLVYDKQTGEINEQNFYNEDDISKKQLNIGGASENIRAVENNRYYLSIPAHQLRSALEAGELQGKLKEVASKITDDDNPVLMLIKFK